VAQSDSHYLFFFFFSFLSFFFFGEHQGELNINSEDPGCPSEPLSRYSDFFNPRAKTTCFLLLIRKEESKKVESKRFTKMGVERKRVVKIKTKRGEKKKGIRAKM
jgi:hypothetical protein